MSATVSPGKRRTPKGFSLDEYLDSGEFGFLLSERQLKLEALIDGVVARTLEETALSDDQKILPKDEDEWLLKATVPDTRTLRGWLLSYGPRLEVVKPSSLRSELAIEVQEMASRYWRSD